MKIGILGGTGKEGSGLAFRWALQGHAVMLGSRDAIKALAGARELNTLLNGKATVQGAANRDAAANADVVVLARSGEAGEEFADELPRERVAVVGGVEGEGGDAVRGVVVDQARTARHIAHGGILP